MRQLLKLLSVLIVLPFIGTVGFVFIEDYGVLDALYMSIITLSTVGYEVIHPLSDGGKIFVICFLIVGLSLFAFSMIQIGELAVSGELNRFLTRRKMKKEISSLKKHYIICGAGRMGMRVCRHLAQAKQSFVVIDTDEAALVEVRKNNWLCLIGDATEDSVLKMAGIERAKSLATLLTSDASNVFVTLSARLLSKDLKIYARASYEDAAVKLRKAGADHTVSPITAGALKVTQLMANPNMEEFIEIFSEEGHGIDLTVVKVEDDAPYIGQTLLESDFRELGVMIVGIKRHDGKLLLPPLATDIIQPQDTLIAVGQAESLLDVVRHTHR